MIRSGIHFGGPGSQARHLVNTLEGPDTLPVSDRFHVYSLEWQPYEMRWSVDGRTYAVLNAWSSVGNPYPAPFDTPFYFVLGMAVSAQREGHSVEWPREMRVDWIRVYQALGNAPPRVGITRPVQDAQLAGGESVRITAEASDPDANLARVEFYNGENLLASDESSPYDFDWPAPDGCHNIIVRAVDLDGFAHTDAVKVEVGAGCPPTPFSGQPARIPGRIEAEDYDKSIKGEACSDSDASNNGNAYRWDGGVDVQPCAEGGFDVCWMITGEWMQYTVAVDRTGRYDIRCRVASPNDTARVRLAFLGTDVAVAMSIPNTGDWQRYTDVSARDVELPAGIRVMRITVEHHGLNFNHIDIRPSSGGQ
jgi:hypothetical protein